MKDLYLTDYIDIHEGEKFLVCGMGTSIDQYPKSFYEGWDGITIGVNEVTELFTPDYHFNVNVNHDKPYNAFWDSLGRDIRYEYMTPSGKVDIDKTGRLSMRGTGALPAVTSAFQMGASEIYIIGVDLRCAPDGQVYYTGCSKEPKEYYQLADKDNPEVQATLRCFSDVFNAYRRLGVCVYNLSYNTRLEGIDTVRLSSDYEVVY